MRWIARYPKEASLYSRFLEYLVSDKEFAAANQLHCRSIRNSFPAMTFFR